MRRKRVCGYYRLGYTMSRRGRIALTHDEYPLGYFTNLFKMSESATVPLLTYMGIHHTGMYGTETKFYRLPDKNDVNELSKIFNAFHLIPANQKTFIDVMSDHFQKSIDEKNKKILKSKQPRKRIRRRDRIKKRIMRRRARRLKSRI